MDRLVELEGLAMNGMRPALKFTPVDDGGYILHITPGAIWGAQPKNMRVTHGEMEAILKWMNGKYLIQEVLPHWTDEQRELIMTGMDTGEFEAYLEG